MSAFAVSCAAGICYIKGLHPGFLRRKVASPLDLAENMFKWCAARSSAPDQVQQRQNWRHAMGLEIELKLGIAPSNLGKVAGLPWLSEILSGPAKSEKLVTVYFDTAKLKLREHGLALRIRHAGKKRLQTIKVFKKGGRGAFGRDELGREDRQR
jgi:CYTH domain